MVLSFLHFTFDLSKKNDSTMKCHICGTDNNLSACDHYEKATPTPEAIRQKWDELAKSLERQTRRMFPRSNYETSFYEDAQRELEEDFRHHEFVRG